MITILYAIVLLAAVVLTAKTVNFFVARRRTATIATSAVENGADIVEMESPLPDEEEEDTPLLLMPDCWPAIRAKVRYRTLAGGWLTARVVGICEDGFILHRRNGGRFVKSLGQMRPRPRRVPAEAAIAA